MAAPIPVLGRLRLAKLIDLHRIGFVAAAAFYHSTFFPYARPFYAKYPIDTVASYRAEYQKAILDPKKVVLVALANHKDNEVGSVYDVLKEIYPSNVDIDKDGKVIVRITSMSLEIDPGRHGKFQPVYGPNSPIMLSYELILALKDPGQPEPPKDPEDRKRDSFPDALKLVDKALKALEEKWLEGHMEILSLGVHPAYWRSGYGSELTKWCLALADTDGVPTCVSAAPMGATLFKSVGFVERGLVVIPGYEHHPESIDLSFEQRVVSAGITRHEL